MKKVQFLGMMLIALLVVSCGTGMKDTWVKENYQAKTFDKILVFGAFNTLEARKSFENTVVELLSDKGINAENSMTALPPSVKVSDMSEETIVKAVQDGGYDAVIVASLIDVNNQDVRESGGGAYVVRPYRLGYGRYAYARVGYMYSPDYYRQQTTYYVESSLFDTQAKSKEESLIWTGQSGITDPASYKAGAKDYAKRLVTSLLKEGVLVTQGE